MERKNSFTLIELVVVLAVILVLSGLILVTSAYVQAKVKRSRAAVEIAAISTALENYRTDNGVYPSNTETNTLNPATVNPDRYRPASSFLYTEISGDDDANPLTAAPSGAKDYFGGTLQLSMLSPRTPGPNTYLQDPFRNSYGYSTAKAVNPSIGHNPSFDLWSTGNSTDPSQWIKNW